MTTWTTRRLAVGGAVLHLETAGPGGDAPVLALVGHPMGAGDFHDLAEQLTGERTVLLHDPRGFGASPLDDPEEAADPHRLADDLAVLLREVLPPGARADVLGSSGGAVTALALAARHPDLVGAVVAHEPPLFSVLPDAGAVRARAGAVVALLHEQGLWPALAAFTALAGLGGPPAGAGSGQQPDPQPDPQTDPQAAAMTRLIAKGLLTVCGYVPDVAGLLAAEAGGARLVLAAGEDSGSQLARRGAEGVAALLGRRVVTFPGDHAPFVAARGGDPAGFAARLREVLAGGAGAAAG